MTQHCRHAITRNDLTEARTRETCSRGRRSAAACARPRRSWAPACRQATGRSSSSSSSSNPQSATANTSGVCEGQLAWCNSRVHRRGLPPKIRLQRVPSPESLRTEAARTGSARRRRAPSGLRLVHHREPGDEVPRRVPPLGGLDVGHVAQAGHEKLTLLGYPFQLTHFRATEKSIGVHVSCARASPLSRSCHILPL